MAKTLREPEELDKLIQETKTQIIHHKHELSRLELQLSSLLKERNNLSFDKSGIGEDTIKVEPRIGSPRRNLPIAPVRQLSQGESVDEKQITRSSTSSFVSRLAGSSPKLHKRPVSCSLEDISRISNSSPSLLSSMKGKKFSTIDLRFLKRLTRSPTRWDGSNLKLSISSMEEALSETNSINTSTDDLDALNSSRSEEVNGFS